MRIALVRLVLSSGHTRPITCGLLTKTKDALLVTGSADKSIRVGLCACVYHLAVCACVYVCVCPFNAHACACACACASVGVLDGNGIVADGV